MAGAMSWNPEIEELKRRMELARRMGGAENVERQHKAGRLTVRERIEPYENEATRLGVKTRGMRP
ncbi:MAG: hypothetical protein AAB418_04775 [candidate division NC10 bacterium]